VTEMYALIEIAIWSSRAIISGTHLPSRWGCRSSASRMHTIQPPNLSFNPDASPSALARRPLGAG